MHWSQTGPGRSYSLKIAAAVRALVGEAGLSQREAAARAGLRVDTVARWARHFGWRRAGGGSRLPSPSRGGAGGGGRSAGATVEVPPARLPSGPPVRDIARGSGNRPREGEGGPGTLAAGFAESGARRPYRHPPEVVEAARARVEGSRDGMERIGLELGIARWTLHRWKKRFGWRRPAPPDKGGLGFYRSRRFGRAWGGDAVATARDLVTGSNLPHGRIATRAGVSRATLYRWKTRPGWTPPVAPGSRYHAPYGPEIMAAARELYQVTELSTRFIAARVKTTPERVRTWARTGGWTRPRDMPDAHGRVRKRRIRRRAAPG